MAKTIFLTGILVFMNNRTAATGVQPRKYGGKELDRMNGLDWVDNEARMYDPLIGSTPTMDTQCERYYGISPYAWCGGNPVRYIDPSGNIIRTYMNGVAYYFKMGLDGSYGFYDKGGNLYHSDDYNDYINQLTAALEQLRMGPVGCALVDFLADSRQYVDVEYVKLDENGDPLGNEADTNNNTVRWDPTRNRAGLTYYPREGYDSYRPAFIGLAHEFAHIIDKWLGTEDNNLWFIMPDGRSVPKAEIYACQVENVIRKEHKIPNRAYYSSYYSFPIETSRIPAPEYPINMRFPYIRAYWEKKQKLMLNP
ncbi:MAG: hypothetical protein IJU62_09790 [Muribaculaceae bacterium]|nr:hypothetical protein [Muribaculaceae bacterium]